MNDDTEQEQEEASNNTQSLIAELQATVLSAFVAGIVLGAFVTMLAMKMVNQQ